MALAWLALGEQAPAAFPVRVSIEAHGAALQVSVDGQTHRLSSPLGGGWRGVALQQPGPLDREYQLDGSDTTSTNDRDRPLIAGLLDTPVYAFDAWLRDEGSYSRWEHLVVRDLDTGQLVPLDATSPLPTDFRLDVELRRPEAPARVWLLGPTDDRREGLELDRDRRNARWLIQRGTGIDALPRWFFPEQPMPFAAELLHLSGRAAAAGYALVVAALALGALARRLAWLADSARSLETRGRSPFDPCSVGARGRNPLDPQSLGGRRIEPHTGARTPGLVRLTAGGALGVWLAAAAAVTIQLYHQLPHVLDAVSYTFQAGLFASGQLALPAPAVPDAFKGPFEVLWGDRIFSQYPPGAPAAYALGRAVGLAWLVGPVACALLLAATAWSASRLYGRGCGLAVLGLGLISPFVLFQAGSYLSHPIAAGLLGLALAAFVAGEQRGTLGWYGACGALLGAGFVVREAASVLFALPLGVRLLATRRWPALSWLISFGLPFLLAYLVYNARQTGSPLLLPRAIFDPSDHFGFGDGIGFHTRHTLAAGLANTDELLTLLQFDLFGWPPLFAFGLMAVPFLLGRARAWDRMALGGVLAFVVAYVGYFYHGIALGPRYYFEAMPWLLLLAGRGVQVLAELAGGRPAPVLLMALLTLNTVGFYTPAELRRRTDLSGLPGGAKLSLDFVQPSLFGPVLDGVPDRSLVVTDQWWIYNTALAPLNCPRLPSCTVLFALATSAQDEARLREAYPGRTLLRAVDDDGRLELVPSS